MQTPDEVFQHFFDNLAPEAPMPYEEYVDRYGDLWDPVSHIKPTKEEYENKLGYKQRYESTGGDVNTIDFKKNV